MRNRSKHEPIDSYFYLARHIDNSMMRVRAYNFNSHIDPIRTKMNSTQQTPVLQVFSSDEIESKGIVVEKLIAGLFCG